ncbi:alpha-acetolactate decarboxylase [Hyaloscypha variabilis]|uniref:Alpha-acetolactate decarboxylase n=1 Tax=Hyaloscypha variabilis (strain UAMH 11265 / GT02V1 / F) TaxID=1149755 RepID=A0A2J6S8G0_HYAVF|nr:alpha-acetolactate decarboxylase [Hyaloscypha variabilis F]
MSALMSGLASPASSIPVSELLTHGDFGVGTFEGMDGEMVVVDSKAYQFRGDGSTHEVSPDQLAPFAMVSRFVPQLTKTIKTQTKAALQGEIESTLPDAKNAFVLFKVHGKFDRIKIRAIHAQSYPGQPLPQLTEGQMIKEFHSVKGTIVGLRSPGWSVGVSVVGVHAHFINEDRKSGGHILELSTEEDVLLELAVSDSFHLQLPKSSEFGARELELDEAGINKAEG